MRRFVVLVAALVLITAGSASATSQISPCWERYEDGSALNLCTGEQINVPW